MMNAVNLHEAEQSNDTSNDPFHGVLKGHSARRKWFLLAIVIVLVAACGGAIGALTSRSSESSDRTQPVSSGGSAPSPTGSNPDAPHSPTDEQDTTGRDSSGATEAPTSAIYSYLKSIVPDGGFNFDFFADSYQRKALEFVQENCDGCSLDRIRTRYALACLFYATNAVRSPYTDYEIGVNIEVTPWLDATNWWTDDECTWFGITCNNEGLVVKIDLHENFLTGNFPAEIVLLKDSLKHLDLENNLVYSVDDELDWLGKMTRLETLNIAQTPFEYNGIPPSIGRLTNLVHLDISYTLFFGPLRPEVFENLNQLQYLYMGGNSYNSSIPSTVSEMENLLYLYVEYSDIEGDLSFLKTGMSKIFEFWADRNPKLTGAIPSEIGELITLESLSLSNCGLTGPIPEEMGNLYRMQQMWLFGNQLEGEIPASIGNLTRMYRLEMENNKLEGDMPPEICDLAVSNGILDTLEADCLTTITNCDCCTCCGSKCAVQAQPSKAGNQGGPPGNERQRRLNFVTEQRRRRRLQPKSENSMQP